jgi:hypothetical protein
MAVESIAGNELEHFAADGQKFLLHFGSTFKGSTQAAIMLLSKWYGMCCTYSMEEQAKIPTVGKR